MAHREDRVRADKDGLVHFYHGSYESRRGPEYGVLCCYNADDQYRSMLGAWTLDGVSCMRCLVAFPAQVSRNFPGDTL